MQHAITRAFALGERLTCCWRCWGPYLGGSFLRRIDTISRTARLMDGDLSARIPARGNNDETINSSPTSTPCSTASTAHGRSAPVSSDIAHDLPRRRPSAPPARRRTDHAGRRKKLKPRRKPAIADADGF